MAIRAPTLTILAAHTHTVVNALCRLGLDRTELIEGLPIDLDRSPDTDARIPLSAEISIWRRASRRVGVRTLGLQVATSLTAAPWGLIGLALADCGSVGEAYRQLQRYIGLLLNGLALDITDDGVSAVTVSETMDVAHMEPIWLEDIYEPQMLECVAAQVVLLGRRLAGWEWVPDRTEFLHDAEGSPLHRRIFGDQLAYGRAVNRLTISREVWDAGDPLRHRSASKLLSHLDAMLASLPPIGAHGGRVRACVAELLTRGSVTEANAAQYLGVSERTMRRQLKAEGTSFRSILDDVRRQLALRYLDGRRHTICDVAFMLGYSEQSAFQRAFRRWTNSTPKRYRDEQ